MAEIQLRKKYRTGKQFKRTPYRTRTGPKCCNGNCPAKASVRAGGSSFSMKIR